MISELQGQLDDVADGRIWVRTESITYEVLIPAADDANWRARLGEAISVHTLHYLESIGQGSSFAPRLIGFCKPQDRRFFEQFTKVKGIGIRKALRAMAAPVPVIARAIASRDITMLKTLPEVGKRTAETIIAELHGKIDEFTHELHGQTGAGAGVGAGAGAGMGAGAGSPTSIGETGGGGGESEAPDSARFVMAQDALLLLSQLGEPLPQARQLIDRVLALDPELNDLDELIAAVYRVKSVS